MSLKLSGLVSGMDTESMVKELMKAQNLKKTKIDNKITTAEWKKDKWKALNSKIYSFYTGSLSKLKMQGSYNTKKVVSSDETKATVTATSSSSAGTQTLKINQLASSQILTGAAIAGSNTISSSTKLSDLGMNAGTITVTSGTNTGTLNIDANSTVDSVLKAFKDAGVNANYDATQRRFFVSSKQSGIDNSFNIATSNGADISKLGLITINKETDGTFTKGAESLATLVEPKNSEIELNGVKISSSSNVVSVNSLTITLKSLTDGATTTGDATDDKAINLNVTNDTQAVYDMVKNFLKTYNELLAEMNDDYDAESAKGYAPLTDEQKESMTDDQIEKWETKIKNALLRRDDNLSSLVNTFRTTFTSSVDVNGKKYSLSSFGITSVNYTEKGKLHIKGDSEDSLTAGQNNDLMTALENDPDAVASTLTALADKLYTSLTNSMKSTTLRSALTLYNDKEMTKQITNYKTDLKTLQDKLDDMESRYYKQFSAMESAMAKMNSQSSSLSSLLGTSS